MASSLERTFETLWHLMAGPAYVREYEALPPRRWRLDAAWPDLRIGVELDGGGWNRGRHHREEGFTNDCIKGNALALAGWTVFHFTPSMLDNDPHGHLAPLVDFVRQKQHERNMQ